MQPLLTTVDVVYGVDILRGDTVPKNQMEPKMSLLATKSRKSEYGYRNQCYLNQL